VAEQTLARNCVCNQIASGAVVAVAGAYDVSFVINQCTAFKLQGSMDNGTTYNDIAGSSTNLGTSGTLTLTTTYLLSLTRTRFSHVKPVFSGTNPVVSYIRRVIRQAPVNIPDTTQQVVIIDPVAGTP
jgi:hypothetical protein